MAKKRTLRFEAELDTSKAEQKIQQLGDKTVKLSADAEGGSGRSRSRGSSLENLTGTERYVERQRIAEAARQKTAAEDRVRWSADYSAMLADPNITRYRDPVSGQFISRDVVQRRAEIQANRQNPQPYVSTRGPGAANQAAIQAGMLPASVIQSLISRGMSPEQALREIGLAADYTAGRITPEQYLGKQRMREIRTQLDAVNAAENRRRTTSEQMQQAPRTRRGEDASIRGWTDTGEQFGRWGTNRQGEGAIGRVTPRLGVEDQVNNLVDTMFRDVANASKERAEADKEWAKTTKDLNRQNRLLQREERREAQNLRNLNRQMLREDRATARVAASDFRADIAGLSPRQQMLRMEERLATLSGGGGGPPPPNDPNRREWESLRQQSRHLRQSGAGSFWNQSVLPRGSGMGLYMNAMFGLWELASMNQALSTSSLNAAYNSRDPAERMTMMVEGLNQASGGILSGISRLVWDTVGDYLPIDTVKKGNREATIQSMRYRTQFETRDSVMRVAASQQQRAALLAGDYASQIADVDIQTSMKKEELQRLTSNLKDKLHGREDYYFKSWYEFWGYSGSYNIVDDPAARTDLRNQIAQNAKEAEEAERRGEAQKAEITYKRQTNLMALRYSTQSNALIGTGQDFAHQMNLFLNERLTIGREKDQDLRDAKIKELESREEGFFRSVERSSRLQTDEMNYGTRANQLGMSGFSGASARAALNAKFAPIFDPKTGAVVGFTGIDPSLPTAQFQELTNATMGAYNAGQRAIDQSEQRQLIQFQGSTAIQLLEMQRRPWEAASQAIRTRGQMERAGMGMMGMLSPEFMRSMIQEGMDLTQLEHNRNMAAQLISSQLQSSQASLTNRSRAMNAMLSRDPILAGSIQLVGQAESEVRSMNQEAQRLYNDGFRSEARTRHEQAKDAAEIGVLSLQLYRQQYLDSFKAVETDFDLMRFGGRSGGENPQEALTSIAKSIQEIRTIIENLKPPE